MRSCFERYDSEDHLINIQDLHDYCEKVRAIFKSTPRFDFPSSSSLYYSEFPNGCCDETSQVLASLISEEFGIIPVQWRGSDFSEHSDISSHIWLEVDGVFVDITLFQFNRCGYSFPLVYVGTKLNFYDYFKCERIIDGRHFSGAASSILQPVYEMVKRELGHNKSKSEDAKESVGV
jgi:hypothetical protein